MEENSAFRLSERSRAEAEAARALGVLAGAGTSASTIVRSRSGLAVTRRGGRGSRVRLSGTCVWARTSSIETSFGGVAPTPREDERAWDERAGRVVTGA